MSKFKEYIYYSPETDELYTTTESLSTKKQWVDFNSPYGVVKVTKVGQFDNYTAAKEVNEKSIFSNTNLFPFV